MIKDISESGIYDTYNGIPVIPIQHASGANPRFYSMLHDMNLLRLISEILSVGKTMNRRKLYRAIELSRDRSTCYTPYQKNWSHENPAYGQCYVTALVVNDYLGGDIVKARLASGVSHYRNIIAGEEVDLTRSQFDEDEDFSDHNIVHHASRDNMRYTTLNKRVEEKLKNMQYGQ